jgi:hypothetical protein
MLLQTKLGDYNCLCVYWGRRRRWMTFVGEMSLYKIKILAFQPKVNLLNCVNLANLETMMV